MLQFLHKCIIIIIIIIIQIILRITILYHIMLERNYFHMFDNMHSFT